MIDTSYDSERQAGLSSANLVRVGLFSLVHSFRFSAQHLTCLPRFLPPSRVPCSTVLARLLWREMWPNHAIFLIYAIPNRFSCCHARAFIPLCINSFVLRSFHETLRIGRHGRHLGDVKLHQHTPSMRSLTCVCSICSRMPVSFYLSQLLTSSSHIRRVGWTGREYCTILFLWRSLHLYCSSKVLESTCNLKPFTQ